MRNRPDSSLDIPIVLLMAALAVSTACGDGESTEPVSTPENESTPARFEAMRPIRVSTIALDLEQAGIDLGAAPSLESLVDELKNDPDDARLKVLMRSFNRSLGVRCSGCHTVKNSEGKTDYEAETPQKKLAVRMWDHFLGSMVTKKGFKFYCDSCHQGTAEFLIRTDREALSEQMKENFVEGLTLRNGATLRCETCHGEGMNMKFLEAWRVGQ